MSKLIVCFLSILMFCASLTHAETELLDVDINVADTETLQRGAQIFMNYCSGCHSLRYMRYNRMAKDLGLTTFTGEIDRDLLFNNLIFTSAKLEQPIENSMPATDARQWFGRVPPDLSLTARERTPAWVYTYLKSFYLDKKRPFGANNALVPDVAMPNILAPLEGKVIAKPAGMNGNSAQPVKLVLIKEGEISEQQFDSMILDLVTFLTYVSEPVQLIRYQIGIIVIFFLLIFLLVAYLLKKSYWKELKKIS